MAGWKVALWVTIVLVALYFLYLVRGILLPFILAGVISALLEPTIQRLRAKGLSRWLAVCVVFFAFFGILATLTIYLTPMIVSQFSEFGSKLEVYIQEVAQQSDSESVFLNWNPAVRAQPVVRGGPLDTLLGENRQVLEKLGIPTTRSGLIEQYIEPYRSQILDFIRNFFSGFLILASSLASKILFLLLTPLIVFLILIDMDRFKDRTAYWIPPAIRANTLSLLQDIGEVFMKYLRGLGKTICVYTLYMAVILGILQLPYFMLVAIFAGILYLVPYIGPWISAVTIFIVVGFSGANSNWLLHFKTTWAFAATITAIFLVLSTIFDQAIYPRLVGKSVGLHPVVSMFVIFSGGALFGVFGMILAFPIAGALKIILERLMCFMSVESAQDIKLPAIPMRHRSSAQL